MVKSIIPNDSESPKADFSNHQKIDSNFGLHFVSVLGG